MEGDKTHEPPVVQPFVVAPAPSPGAGVPQLHLCDLGTGMHGVTPSFGTMLAEVAAVCLEDQQHASGVQMKVTGNHQTSIAIHWNATTGQQRRNWADSQEATEFGANGCAILLIKRLIGLQVTERSRKGTGFDWWLGDDAASQGLFQDKARLEVSGIRKGNESEIQSRVDQKLGQTTQSDAVTTLPAWAVVVEFGGPQTRAVKR